MLVFVFACVWEAGHLKSRLELLETTTTIVTARFIETTLELPKMLGFSIKKTLLVLSLLGTAFANTEIVNFAAVLSPDRIIDASAFNVSW